MTTTRIFSFQHPGEWKHPEAYVEARKVLRAAQRQYWWYEGGEVQGEPFNRLVITFTTHGRDQWWCYHRAMKLAIDCYYAMGLSERDVPAPVWEPLEPHTNRGRYRVVR